MIKLSWLIPIALLFLLAAIILTISGAESEPAVTKTDDAIWTRPDIANALTDNVETSFKFDAERLYDISYEVDPGLVEFAASVGKSPACLVELVKRQVDGIVHEESRCQQDSARSADKQVLLPGTYENECRIMRGKEVCRRVKVADHPYEQFSDEDLRALASVSPEAAVILARRTPDITLSEQYYEQAVVLSGRPGPLEEWMLHRNTGGLVRVGGILDLDKAKIGYEIYLTTARLGYAEAAAAEYERVLINANVDLDPIQQRASERVARLTAARRAIVGTAWEE